MNPKIEVVKLNIQKKGQQVGTFSVKVLIEGGCEIILPGMRIVEGSKGTFVDLPARKFKDVGFVPHYYLNKGLRDLVTQEALTIYRKKGNEMITGKTVTTASPVAPAVKTATTTTATPAQAAARPAITSTLAPAKSWRRKEWKPSFQKK